MRADPRGAGSWLPGLLRAADEMDPSALRACPEQMMGSKSRMQGKVLPERSATQVYVGIDVCKARLDVYLHPLGAKFAVSNDAHGFRRLKRSLEGHEVALVVMEATGKLHRAAHRSLVAESFAVAVVNPLRSRLFAEAAGALAKTDGVDARMLAVLGESMKPSPTAPPSALMQTLRDVLRCRDAAVAARTALLNQLGEASVPVAIAEIKRQIRAVETSLANLEAEIERLIAADPSLARRLAVLTSIPGIGTTTAVALIVGLAPACAWRTACPLSQPERPQGPRSSTRLRPLWRGRRISERPSRHTCLPARSPAEAPAWREHPERRPKPQKAQEPRKWIRRGRAWSFQSGVNDNAKLLSGVRI